MKNLLVVLKENGINITNLKDLREVARNMSEELEKEIIDSFGRDVGEDVDSMWVGRKYKIFVGLNHYELFKTNPDSYKKDRTDIYGGLKHCENSTEIYEVIGDIAMLEGCEPIKSYFD